MSEPEIEGIDLIQRIHTLAEANERKVMSPQELSGLVNLENGDGRYGRVFKQNVEES